MPFGQKEKTTNVIKAPRVIDSHALASAWLVTIIILVLQGSDAVAVCGRQRRLRSPAAHETASVRFICWVVHWRGHYFCLALSDYLVRSVPRATWLSSRGHRPVGDPSCCPAGRELFLRQVRDLSAGICFWRFHRRTDRFMAYTKSGAAIPTDFGQGARSLPSSAGLSALIASSASLLH